MTTKWRRMPQWICRRLPENFAGITMPWRTVYLTPAFWDCPKVRAHESVHIEQIERDGAILFSVKYLWWLARRGYWANPYEIEAYRRAATD